MGLCAELCLPPSPPPSSSPPPLSISSARSPAGRGSGQRFHPGHVCQPQSQREKNHLLPLHLRHGHGQHSICLPRGEGPHLAGQPGDLQPGLRAAGCCNSIGFVQLAARRSSAVISAPASLRRLPARPQHRTLRSFRVCRQMTVTTDVFEKNKKENKIFPVRLFESGRLQL